MKRSDIFEVYPIPKAVWSLSLPLMMGMLITVIYNIAGAFFVGQLNDVNKVAAIAISMPISMLLMACGTIFGIGGGSYISRMLGLKDYKKIREASSFSFYAAIALGILCTILGLLFMPQILSLSGASEGTYNYAKSYLSIIAACSPLVILSFSLGQIVRSEGAPKESMFGMILGTVLNIVLDPILILFLHLGVTGAAIASVVANAVSVIYYCRFFLKKNSLVSLSIKDFSLDKPMLISIFSIGLPASLNSVLMSISSVVMNNFAVSYGNQVVAALGVIGRLNMLPVLLLIGLAQGIQPLIGYNFATRNFDRMKQALRYTSICGIIIGTVFTVIYFFGASHAIRFFINDPEVISLGTKFIRRIILSIPILSVLFVITAAFQAFGMAVPSLILSISRQGLFFIPLLIILNKFIGLNGLVYAQPLTDILSILFGIAMLLKILKSDKMTQNV